MVSQIASLRKRASGARVIPGGNGHAMQAAPTQQAHMRYRSEADGARKCSASAAYYLVSREHELTHSTQEQRPRVRLRTVAFKRVL